ncbi:glycosyltransferase [uncultured Anaeromusa sp.]|uniref:MGDG synthase family glycosyltransferase n=1 Tax=uncultured Anaeromusa sp. TaxID=673273 RepID=UPI0029C8368A|nr:glycosyltransferase [uncultured Anaeromusa sp.]NCB75677.1 glycosyltransferase [Negativicutes bacterium]
MAAAKKRVLIVSASIGSGHHQAARAIAAELARRQDNLQITIADFMEDTDSYLAAFMKEAYLKMLELSPNMYDLVYRVSQAPLPGFKAQGLLARVLQGGMAQLVRRHRPDLIIATHPFPCGAAAYLRDSRRLRAPLVGVITDFAVHRLWVYEHVDAYFVAAPEIKRELSALGVPARRIYASGIPVHPQFTANAGGRGILGELSLAADQPLVLLMGGGLGMGGIRQALASMDELKLPLQFVVLAGKNKELQEKLQEETKSLRHAVRVLGYTDRIPELMRAAAMLVTKPGALTVCEALVSETPLLLYEPIPGQEWENAVFLTQRGVALWAKNRQELKDGVTTLLTRPEQVEKLRKEAEALRRPAAAAAVATAALALLRRKR